MTDPKPSDRSYRRSWKNLLLIKSYQLRFTLFMVGLAAVLMVGLGVWVMRVANETTEVSTASVRGKACPKLPMLDDAATGDTGDAAPAAPAKLDESPDGPAGDSPAPASAAPAPAAPAANEAATEAASPPTGGSAVAALAPPAPAASVPAPATQRHARTADTPPRAAVPGAPSTPGAPAAPDDEPRHVTVQIDESSMTLAMPPDLVEQVLAHWTCELRQIDKLDRLERERMRIEWAMIATGLLLVLGLAAYGIKMTHRVAGPLFKVSLYFQKMRGGRFDKVYNLRKGDQLVEFYDHFKLAHDGVAAMQRDDIARIAAVIAAAEAAGAGGHPAVAELRALLARKEKSIE